MSKNNSSSMYDSPDENGANLLDAEDLRQETTEKGVLNKIIKAIHQYIESMKNSPLYKKTIGAAIDTLQRGEDFLRNPDSIESTLGNIMQPINKHVIQPLKKNVMQPINEHVIQPLDSMVYAIEKGVYDILESIEAGAQDFGDLVKKTWGKIMKAVGGAMKSVDQHVHKTNIHGNEPIINPHLLTIYSLQSILAVNSGKSNELHKSEVEGRKKSLERKKAFLEGEKSNGSTEEKKESLEKIDKALERINKALEGKLEDKDIEKIRESINHYNAEGRRYNANLSRGIVGKLGDKLQAKGEKTIEESGKLGKYTRALKQRRQDERNKGRNKGL